MDESRHHAALQPRFLVLFAMIFVAAMVRLVEHPLNMAPVGAIALFGGAHLVQKRWAFLVTLSAMVLSDLVLYAGRYANFRDTWHTTAFPVYLSYALIVCLGIWLSRRPRFEYIVLATLSSSVLFFLITNFACWAIWDMYPKSLSGLVECYVAGIPFFRNTLLGDAIYVTVLFGGFALCERRFPILRQQPMLGGLK